ncbi:MAG: biotin synthase BioB [Christensenella sp.]|uniref:biotin synthase BioB n=1 Tax=Christensenella sp. TaxID=1935934 RepID=UPI002B207F83|nr:biotin synthase BioB [Christensenella sp.]MEA5004006.1 biotin synthase BioB [Christensenella sp.]
MDFLIDMTQKALHGQEITRKEALMLAQEDVQSLCVAADQIRKERCGDTFDLCSIINGKSGKCPEDCKYCAQSAHYKTDVEFYELLCKEEIVAAARKSYDAGVGRFSIVTSGKKLTHDEIKALCGIYRAIKRACPQLRLCASHGLLDEQAFVMLKEAGVERYHNNLETSREFFKNICTTHSYDDKLKTIRRAQNAELGICSGGIIGMGEEMAERIDMALELRRLGVRSVPLNILTPLEGTPFANAPALPQQEIMKTAAVFRFLLPDTAIRLAGGRARMENAGRAMLGAGVNAAITGDMLTTAGFSYESDMEMITSCGFTVGFMKNKC